MGSGPRNQVQSLSMGCWCLAICCAKHLPLFLIFLIGNNLNMQKSYMNNTENIKILFTVCSLPPSLLLSFLLSIHPSIPFIPLLFICGCLSSVVCMYLSHIHRYTVTGTILMNYLWVRCIQNSTYFLRYFLILPSVIVNFIMFNMDKVIYSLLSKFVCWYIDVS